MYVFLLIFCPVVVSILSLALGYNCAESDWRSEVIERGFGFWSVDPVTGKTSFEWSDRR